MSWQRREAASGYEFVADVGGVAGTSWVGGVGRDIADLRYIADIIRESGKVLVIEDFHYLSTDERRNFAFDLKALWDYGCLL